jgi:Domain of unknown function (DUF5666)
MKMHNTHRRPTLASALLCAAVLLSACGHDSPPATTPENIRGTIQSVDGDALTVTTSAGSVRVRLGPSTTVAAVVQADPAHIAEGAYVGIASVTDPDGSQRAVGALVFPEAMRGAAEGHVGWDWPNGSKAASKMTNGTVSSSKMTNGTVTAQSGTSSVTLRYKNGTSSDSQTITIPPGLPVVDIKPGQAGDLQPGDHIFVVATRSSDGALTAGLVLAGKNGVVPPI